jgi:hypothetical protein
MSTDTFWRHQKDIKASENFDKQFLEIKVYLTNEFLIRRFSKLFLVEHLRQRPSGEKLA